MDTLGYWKGHGTENDFVLLPDHDGTLLGDLPPSQVAELGLQSVRRLLDDSSA